MIPEEANRLYDMLLKYLTNSIMDNIAMLLLRPILLSHLHSQGHQIVVIHTGG